MGLSINETFHLNAVKAKAIEWTNDGLLSLDPMADILWEIAQESIEGVDENAGKNLKTTRDEIKSPVKGEGASEVIVSVKQAIVGTHWKSFPEEKEEKHAKVEWHDRNALIIDDSEQNPVVREALRHIYYWKYKNELNQELIVTENMDDGTLSAGLNAGQWASEFHIDFLLEYYRKLYAPENVLLCFSQQCAYACNKGILNAEYSIFGSSRGTFDKEFILIPARIGQNHFVLFALYNLEALARSLVQKSSSRYEPKAAMSSGLILYLDSIPKSNLAAARLLAAEYMM